MACQDHSTSTCSHHGHPKLVPQAALLMDFESEPAGRLGGEMGLGEAVTMLACSSNFRSNRRERITLPDGGNQQQELAKDRLSMQMSLRNKTQEGKRAKSER